MWLSRQSRAARVSLTSSAMTIVRAHEEPAGHETGESAPSEASGQGHAIAKRLESWDNGPMDLTVTLDQETDGRWIGAVEGLPGVLAYGATREQAIGAAIGLALTVLADEVAHGERQIPNWDPAKASFSVNVRSAA
jgi:predicted RNase H-like HicB family nuclease